MHKAMKTNMNTLQFFSEHHAWTYINRFSFDK